MSILPKLPNFSRLRSWTLTKTRRLSLLLSLPALTTVFAPSCQAEPTVVLTERPHMNINQPAAAPKWKPDILLVMPNKKSDAEDITTSLQDVHGEVIEQIGAGELAVLMIKIEAGHFNEAEAKLKKDKNFTSVQRDLVFKTNAVSTSPVNDPYYASEWHLSALNVINAWKVSTGGQIIIGVLDSGVNGSITDLRGKTYAGYDAVSNTEGQSDVHGHGTMVSTTAAAITNNNNNTAAPARLAYIYPVRVGYSDGSISSAAILKGVKRCGDLGIKIINISANGAPPYTFANASANSVLHQYFKWFHDQKGGLIFNSAGNNQQRDTNAISPYLIVVSAINNSKSLANFSTYGRPVWFTGPGTGIYCSSKSNTVGAVSGTSFSSPLVASVAALIWGAKPSMSNLQVENILKSTCYKASNNATWTESFGYGMPNAEAAIKATLGQ